MGDQLISDQQICDQIRPDQSKHFKERKGPSQSFAKLTLDLVWVPFTTFEHYFNYNSGLKIWIQVDQMSILGQKNWHCGWWRVVVDEYDARMMAIKLSWLIGETPPHHPELSHRCHISYSREGGLWPPPSHPGWSMWCFSRGRWGDVLIHSPASHPLLISILTSSASSSLPRAWHGYKRQILNCIIFCLLNLIIYKVEGTPVGGEQFCLI